METTHENQTPSIKLNLDEFDIESFDIKPVTKGLGFHNNSSPGVRPKPTQRKGAPKTTTSKKVHQSATHLHSRPQAVSDPALLSGIDAIYGNTTNKELKKVQSVKSKAEPKIAVKNLKKPQLYELGFAFLIDILGVFLLTTALFASFFFFAFQRLDIQLLIRFIENSLPFVVIMTSLIYLTYFSLLEPVGTLGKRVFRMSLYRVKSEKRATIKSSFSRAFISLLSLPLLGIPFVLDFHGKLSDTEVKKVP